MVSLAKIVQNPKIAIQKQKCPKRNTTKTFCCSNEAVFHVSIGGYIAYLSWKYFSHLCVSGCDIVVA